MALVLADRIKETTTTAGTSDFLMAGSVVGFRTFASVMSNGDTTYYAAIAANGSSWEVGIGTYASSTNTLTRTTILSSSNSNNIVAFTTGVKYVFITQPSERAAYVNGTDIVAENGASLKISYGGTGLTSYTAGDLPYYSSGNALSKLGIGTNGFVLTSNGSAPQWSAVTSVAVTTISFGTTGLTPATATGGAVTVAGTLATANGGTNLTSFTSGGAMYATSTSALTTGTLPITAGGTGATTIAGAQTNLQVDPAGTAVAMAIALG